MYSISRMWELIEAANSMPSKAKRYLLELEELSQRIKKNLEKANQSFKDGMQSSINFHLKWGIEEAEKSNDLIEYFIQNIQMIAETGISANAANRKTEGKLSDSLDWSPL